MITKRISIILLFLSAVCFVAYINFQIDKNWSPVSLPMPGPGLEVGQSFHIATAGQFKLQISLPRTDPGSAPPYNEPPALQCNIELDIKNQDGTTIQQTIDWLNPSGFSPGPLDDYAALPLTLSHSGNYMFHLRNKGESNFPCSRGAGVALTRFQRPTGWTLAIILLQPVGWVFLVLGFLAAFISEVKEEIERHAIRKGHKDEGPFLH